MIANPVHQIGKPAADTTEFEQIGVLRLASWPALMNYEHLRNATRSRQCTKRCLAGR